MWLFVWMMFGTAIGAQDVTFVTLRPQSVAKVHEGGDRARRRVSPCSTFKIPNSLIGLETGAIPTPEHVLRYDQAKHRTSGFWVEAWSRDHDLRSAFRASAVWYFKELAVRVGRGNSQAFLDRFEYGNRDTSGWSDPYWLGSTLRISPVEQVEFLDRLFRNTFGLTPRHVEAMESFMRQETKEGRELFFKSGACTDRDAGPGVWLVGFVQNGRERTYFAFHAGGIPMDDLLAQRIELAKSRLAKAGLW